MKKHFSNKEFKQFIYEEIKKLQKQDLIESIIDKELFLLKESELTMDIFNNPEELKKFRQQLMSKITGWEFSKPEMLSEKKVNPWAVCYNSIRPEKTEKFEKCVIDVKKKQGMYESKTKENKEVTEKNFFITDLSGRGYTSNLSDEDLRSNWNLEEVDVYSEESLGEFIDTAEVGDKWSTKSIKIIRTK